MRFERSDSPEPAAPDLHPFLLASFVPAWRRGERRVLVDGSVCPRLRDGLRGAVALLARWSRSDRRAPAIEATNGFRPYARRRDRAAQFLTAGVDSTHMLRVNRAYYPGDHPASFRDAVYAVRLAFLEKDPSPRALDLAARQRRAVEAVCRASGLELVCVDSNFRLLETDVWLAGAQDHAALLAAAAHSLATRVGTVSLASSYDVASTHGWGTDPSLDPLYSSSGVEIRHEGFGPSRLEKIAAIADWPAARENLIVCFEGPVSPGKLNCGRCEKCLRTMTALLVLGVLDEFAAFSGERVTPEKIDAMSLGYVPKNFEGYWAPLLPELSRRGERATERAIRAKIAGARRMLARERGEDLRGRLARFDREHLGGFLRSAGRRLRISIR
jgi:hypothetical protein